RGVGAPAVDLTADRLGTDAGVLLVDNEGRDELAGELTGPSDRFEQHDHARQRPLHVERPAAVEPVVLDACREGVGHPGDADGIHVAVEHQPPSRALADDGDHVRPPAPGVLQLDRDPGCGAKPRGDRLGDLALTARTGDKVRVDRRDTDEVGQRLAQVAAVDLDHWPSFTLASTAAVCMRRRQPAALNAVPRLLPGVSFAAILAPALSREDVGGTSLAQPITPELVVYGLTMAGEPQVSPDGTQILYTLSAVDRETEKGSSQIWLCGIDGSNPRRLTWSGERNSGGV